VVCVQLVVFDDLKVVEAERFEPSTVAPRASRVTTSRSSSVEVLQMGASFSAAEADREGPKLAREL
jgi:hypothetical protein